MAKFIKPTAGLVLMSFIPTAVTPKDHLIFYPVPSSGIYSINSNSNQNPHSIPLDFDPVGGTQGLAKIISSLGSTNTTTTSTALSSQQYYVDIANSDSEPQLVEMDISHRLKSDKEQS